MISSSDREAITSSGNKIWGYHGKDVIMVRWSHVDNHTCEVHFVLENEVLDACQLNVGGDADSYSFHMSNGTYFAMGYVATAKSASQESVLEFNLHYGEHPKTSSISLL